MRASLAGEFPDGVPHWMLRLPDDQVREMMRLRRIGFQLVGLEPGDDPDELFVREED